MPTNYLDDLSERSKQLSVVREQIDKLERLKEDFRAILLGIGDLFYGTGGLSAEEAQSYFKIQTQIELIEYIQKEIFCIK